MSTETASSRGRGHYDRRASASERARQAREAIVGAVRKLLADGDDGMPTVSDVLGLTGLGRNTFYGHFRDVQEVVRELVEASRGEVEAVLGTSQGADETPHAAVQHFVRGWLEFAAREPGVLAIAMRMAREDVTRSIELRVRALHLLGAHAGVFRRELGLERQLAVAGGLAALAQAVALGRARLEPSVAAGQDLVLGLCR